MDLRHHSPAGIRPPFGRYHHVVEVEGARRLLFLSGQLGHPARRLGARGRRRVRPSRCSPTSTPASRPPGSSGVTCVRLSVFLTEAEYRLDYMRVRDAWVADPPPASTLLIVKALALPSCKVEVEAVAAA